jgi:hypothetical protein
MHLWQQARLDDHFSDVEIPELELEMDVNLDTMSFSFEWKMFVTNFYKPLLCVEEQCRMLFRRQDDGLQKTADPSLELYFKD